MTASRDGVSQVHHEDVNEKQACLNTQLAARNAVGLGVEQHQLGVDRHLWKKNDEELSVERYHLSVDRHQPQIPAAIPPFVEQRRTLGNFNRPDLFYLTGQRSYLHPSRETTMSSSLATLH